jgi:hypothetical protein
MFAAQPRRFGGHGFWTPTFLRDVMELARGERDDGA